MKRQKRRTDKQLQRIIGIVCLSFLLGTAGGALLANLLPQGQQGQLSAFFAAGAGRWRRNQLCGNFLEISEI